MLVLGYESTSIHWDHRRYDDRRPDARDDYDRLIIDLLKNGMKNPPICCASGQFIHVLIGMRRVEILKRFAEVVSAPPFDIRVWLITENVDVWTRDDLPRLEKLKNEYGPATY